MNRKISDALYRIPFVRGAVHYIKDKRYAKEFTKNQSKVKKCDPRNAKVVFVVTFPASWNSVRSVYEACVEKGIDVLVLLVKFNHKYEYLWEKFDYASFADKYNCICVDRNSLFDLRQYDPDFVFYTRPYVEEYPESYLPKEVSKYAKTCFIEYGYHMGDTKTSALTRFCLPHKFMFYISFFFLANDDDKDGCAVWFKKLIKNGVNHYPSMGYPRFDLLKNRVYDTHKERKTVLWLPRWTVVNMDGNKGSSFLKFYDDFMLYAESHPSYNFVIRPHPILFSILLDFKVKTQDEIDAIINRINSSENVSLDFSPNYLDALFNADILISDLSSILVEYYVLDRPIIYCDNDTSDFKPLMKDMISSFYEAYTWEQVERTLDQLLSGNDEKKNIRQPIINKILPKNAGKIGSDIIDYLICFEK